MRLVVDANALLKAFLPEDYSEKARAAVGQIGDGGIVAIAPEIFIPEVGHTLRREVVRKKLPRDDAEQIWSDVMALPIEFHSLRGLSDHAWHLALTHMARFYDALYVALAEREDVRVLTADDRLIGAFSALDRTIHIRDFQV